MLYFRILSGLRAGCAAVALSLRERKENWVAEKCVASVGAAMLFHPYQVVTTASAPTDNDRWTSYCHLAAKSFHTSGTV